MLSVIHCTFIFDKVSLDTTVSSIDSLQFINDPIHVYVTGYIYTPIHLKSVNNTLVSLKLKRLELGRSTIVDLNLTQNNRGKSTIINSTMLKVNTEYVLCMDSDIQFLYDINVTRTCCTFGNRVYVCNQQGDIRHVINKAKGVVEGEKGVKGVTIFTPLSSYGVAGGVIMCRSSMIRTIPFVDVGVYGPEDTLFFKQCSEHGVRVSIIDWNVYHPPDHNLTYKEYKCALVETYLTTFFSNIDN